MARRDPLPNHVLPLAGKAGAINLATNMAIERRRWRYAGPMCALCICAALLFFAWRAIA